MLRIPSEAFRLDNRRKKSWRVDNQSAIAEKYFEAARAIQKKGRHPVFERIRDMNRGVKKRHVAQQAV